MEKELRSNPNHQKHHPMDKAKCKALKAELASEDELPIVPIERFFDGNDDLGSIGCNLARRHPGVDAFRDILTGLLRRPDVHALYAQIFELDPGEGSWPFTDTVLVVGEIPVVELSRLVSALMPSEVETAENFGISPSIAARHGAPVIVVWWD
jgi:hypothetical protein